jgi:hypothetical protein
MPKPIPLVQTPIGFESNTTQVINRMRDRLEKKQKVDFVPTRTGHEIVRPKFSANLKTNTASSLVSVNFRVVD